jgi:transposase-like protein
MGRMKGRRRIRSEIVAEYLAGDVSYRELEDRYGVSRSTMNRWVKEFESGKGPERTAIKRAVAGTAAVRKTLPTDVRKLQRELEEARLHNKLLETMIDIAEEQMGVQIRKKAGARRS